MAVFRVTVQSITNVYIDIEAEDEAQARERAEEIDGGDYHYTIDGDWVFGEVMKLNDDAKPDYNNEFFKEMEG